MFVPKLYFSCLGIEITRKCNMNCNFCGRGQAQNLDISKEIIDKSLDEMSDAYINNLRINGGEPLLTQSLIVYLFNKIIEKHIRINTISFFTNGTIEPTTELCESIIKVLDYLRMTELEMQQLVRWSNSINTWLYGGVSGGKIAVIVSDLGRNINKTQVKKSLDVFNAKINDNDFCAIEQSKTYFSTFGFELDGNARKNYRELIGDEVSLSHITIINNEYCFISYSRNLNTEKFIKDTVFIDKAITVSANGNVFPGCMMSYERVDNNPMFNILDCNMDFFDKVNYFCWEHPINKKALSVRNNYQTILFCQNNNITIKNFNKVDFETSKLLNYLVDEYEKIEKDLHQILPNLTFTEIDIAAIATLALNLFESKIQLEYIKLFLRDCTMFDENTINNITAEYCRGLILFMSERNNKRSEQE